MISSVLRIRVKSGKSKKKVTTIPIIIKIETQKLRREKN